MDEIRKIIADMVARAEKKDPEIGEHVAAVAREAQICITALAKELDTITTMRIIAAASKMAMGAR